MTDNQSADAPELELAYSDALEELETILAELETSAVDVDTLAERVGRAAQLVAYCRGRLEVVRTDVAGVVADLTQQADQNGAP